MKDLKKKWLDKQKVALDAIYVDNCCHVRQKISEIFGDSIAIKLDLFHAIARVTKKIPKQTRHYMSNTCITEFANVFRSIGDKKKERKKLTPSPKEILENLNSFLEKWKSVQHGEHEDALTSATMHEIQCLCEHIRRGCLSGIPAGAGSERNENCTKTRHRAD